MHLVGFIIRIYHDARSPERQMELIVFNILKLVITNLKSCLRFEDFTAVDIHVVMLGVTSLYQRTAGYQCYEETQCSHLRDDPTPKTE